MNKFLFICLLLISNVIYAATFNITTQSTLPTTVPEFGKTSVFFAIKNITNKPLINSFVKTLPNNITQVKCNPKYCGAKFNLGASGSPTDTCLLKLSIKGAVNSAALLVCTSGETSCDSSQAITVGLGPSNPFIGIGVGSYESINRHDTFPLLAVTNDTGHNWSYPSAIFQNLNTSIDPTFSGALLSGASCTGSLNKNLCIASGHWCKGAFCGLAQPLIAVGKQNGTAWTLKHSHLSLSVMTVVIHGLILHTFIRTLPPR